MSLLNISSYPVFHETYCHLALWWNLMQNDNVAVPSTQYTLYLPVIGAPQQMYPLYDLPIQKVLRHPSYKNNILFLGPRILRCGAS